MSDSDYDLDEMKEIINEFMIETNEIIESLDGNLVKLEKDPDNLELLNEIFRGAHTMKGTSGFLGFDELGSLTHRMEDVLNKLRKNELQVNEEVMDVLLEAVDYVKLVLQDIIDNQQGRTDTSDIVAKLVKVYNGGSAKPAPQPTGTNKKMQELLTLYPQAKGTKCFEVCRHIGSESGTDFCSWCGIDEVARTGRSVNKIVKSKDNKQWLFSWAPLYDENQIITRIVKTITEITDQIREKSYLESLLMDILVIMPIGIMIVNAENQVVFLNHAMEKRWGLSISQVIGTNIHELEIYGHTDTIEKGFDNLNKGIRSDKIELEVERHDGDKYWVSCQLIPFKKDELGWQGILLEEDLTQLSRDKLFIEQDLKQKEAMLISQDKLFQRIKVVFKRQGRVGFLRG